MTGISPIELIYCLKGENNHRDMYLSPPFLTWILEALGKWITL